MAYNSETRFRCVVCGKLSAGRIPGRGKGDKSFRYPRFHRNGAAPCEGLLNEAEWVEVPLAGAALKRHSATRMREAKRAFIGGRTSPTPAKPDHRCESKPRARGANPTLDTQHQPS